MINKFSEEFKKVGRNLKKERKKAKLTQAQLANRLSKIDGAKISNIENGKEDFMFSTLLEISRGLDIDIEKLVKKDKSLTIKEGQGKENQE